MMTSHKGWKGAWFTSRDIIGNTSRIFRDLSVITSFPNKFLHNLVKMASKLPNSNHAVYFFENQITKFSTGCQTIKLGVSNSNVISQVQIHHKDKEETPPALWVSIEVLSL